MGERFASPLNPPILYYTIGAGKSQVFLAKKIKKIKQKTIDFCSKI